MFGLNDNLILRTDSYKLTHWKQYPANTESVYSYFESRQGATYPETVFFGLQPLLETLARGIVVDDILEANDVAKLHFGNDQIFNWRGWNLLLERYDGQLPLRIKAVPEGTPVPTGNVLMTVENTDPDFYWLTNFVESLLTHVWYPSTVATASREVKKTLTAWAELTGADPAGIDFQLHDFGYRGVTTDAAAEIGGAAHLINFKGTDTLPAMVFARDHYQADLNSLAFSVPATEHSVMTSLGREGELQIVNDLLDTYPTGILSVVSDSYDIYNFVAQLCQEPLKQRILERDGTFVVRPDSGDPSEVALRLVSELWDGFGGTVNARGYRTLNPKVRVLWGDGIGPEDIEKILKKLSYNDFASDNMVFGMGGGLLQKINRDTQRFAFKCSAQYRDGKWVDIQKDPLHGGKKSKPGRLSLIRIPKKDGAYATVPEGSSERPDELVTVFENGQILRRDTFEEIRERAMI
jgi:nicotinamide phosphoribosyltransferase